MIEWIVFDDKAVGQKKALVVSRAIVVAEFLARSIRFQYLKTYKVVPRLPFDLGARLVVEKIKQRQEYSKAIRKELDKVIRFTLLWLMLQTSKIRG